MNERIIGAYKYKHFGNKSKIDKILNVLKEYKKTAKCTAKIQWQLFFSKVWFNEKLQKAVLKDKNGKIIKELYINKKHYKLARKILKQTLYTSKKQVLQILVKQYLERYKGCNSAPCELPRNNPYYSDYLSNSKLLMCVE